MSVLEVGKVRLVQRRTRDRKVASSNLGRSGGIIFFSRVNFLSTGLVIERLRVRIPEGAVGECSSPKLTLSADSYSVSSISVLPQWHVHDLGYSAISARWQVTHLNTQTPLTQRSRNGLTMLSRYSVGNYKGNELTRNSSGNAHPQLSQLAESL